MRESVRRRRSASFCLGYTVYSGAPREVAGLGTQAGVDGDVGARARMPKRNAVVAQGTPKTRKSVMLLFR